MAKHPITPLPIPEELRERIKRQADGRPITTYILQLLEREMERLEAPNPQ